MPEMHFRIRWPDGLTERCYSPSLVVKEHFVVGETYTLQEFSARSRVALNIGGERVRAKQGHTCSRALAQLSRIEARGESFVATPGARVKVEAFEE